MLWHGTYLTSPFVSVCHFLVSVIVAMQKFETALSYVQNQ